MCTTSFHPPLEKYYFALVRELFIANAYACTQGPFWLPWKTALVGWENRLSWPGGLN
jgi:hypothetical protein